MEKGRMDCPWFLTCGSLDGRWWWKNVADKEMHHDWRALMRECDKWRARTPHVDANILGSWSLDDTVGASATVTLRTLDGYITDRDGPCAWDQRRGSPPPWWTDGMYAELVRRVNKVALQIEQAHYAWAYGPVLRECYSHRP